MTDIAELTLEQALQPCTCRSPLECRFAKVRMSEGSSEQDNHLFAICRGGHGAEKRAKYIRSWLGQPQSPVDRPARGATGTTTPPTKTARSALSLIEETDLPCEYRGGLHDVVKCKPCKGGGTATVWECSASPLGVPRFCTILKRDSRYRSCLECDLQPKEVRDAAVEAGAKRLKEQRTRVNVKLSADQVRHRAELGPAPDPLPFTAEPVVNLMYHLYPKRGLWWWHAEQFARIPANGKRIVGIACDDTTVAPDEVTPYFPADKYVIVENNSGNKGKKGLREVATFQEMLPLIDRSDTNAITLCAHSKGMQPHTANADNVRRWTQAMYETVIFNRDGVIDAMARGYTFVGSFRSFGPALRTDHSWHYSGSFYAFRNCLLPDVKFRRVWFGTESWPGDCVPVEKSFCVVCDDIDGAGELYKDETWRVRGPELEAWESTCLKSTH